MKKNRFTTLCIMASMAAAAVVPAMAKENALSKKIIGYYINWGMYAAHNTYGPANVPWTKITHINYAFAEITSGTWQIKGTDDWADLQCGPQQNGQIGQLNALKTQYGVKVLISVGGWTRSGNFSPMAATAAGRAAFARGCAQYVKQYGFDGVDIDWEYPCFVRAPDPNLAGDEACNGIADDKTNFTLMLQKLRQTLDSAGSADQKTYYLSIAAPGGYDKIEGPITFQEPDKYVQYVDWLNVMSYDFHGGWDTVTGHLGALYADPRDPAATSPIDIKNKYNGDAIVKYYQSKGVSMAKMNIGCAYYGRSWKNVNDNGTSGLFQPCTPRDFYETPWNYGVEPFYTLKQWESDAAYKSGYDTVAKAPYLYNASAKLFYTYDNERSIGDKCNYMNANGLGGIFFWDFTGDYPVLGNTLTTAIYNKVPSTKVIQGNQSRMQDDFFRGVTVAAAHGKLTFVNNSPSLVGVGICDITGRRVDSFTLDKGTTVRWKNLSAGIYFCVIGTDKAMIIRVE